MHSLGVAVDANARRFITILQIPCRALLLL